MAPGSFAGPGRPLRSMADENRKADIEKLNELFPRRSALEIKNALTICNGSFDDTMDLLDGSQGPSSSYSSIRTAPIRPGIMSLNNTIDRKVKSEYQSLEDISDPSKRENVANLLDLDLQQPIPVLIRELEKCNWNVDEVANFFLNDGAKPDSPITIDLEPIVEARASAKDASLKPSADTFDPTSPSTPSALGTQPQRWPGGIVDSFVVSLPADEIALARAAQSQQSRTQSLQREGSDEPNPELKPIPTETIDSEMGDVRDEQSPETPSNLTSGFDTEMGGQEESIALKVKELHSLLPDSSKRRCKAILQVYPDMQEAFETVEEELIEYGPEATSSETEESDSDADDNGSESDMAEQGKSPKTSGIGGADRGKGKRSAETPDDEPPAKKFRSLAMEDNNEEAEGAKLEPAGEWVINTFGESGGISISLKNGKHPCKFPRGLLSRHFNFFKERLNLPTVEGTGDPTAETVELLDVERGIFDLVIQMAITKSFQQHKSQSRTRMIEITTLLQLVILGTRLGFSGAGHIAATRLKEILMDRRNALHGSHIETAYTLDKGHPIRKVIVQSLGRAYFILKQGRASKKPVYRRGEADNARRSAFDGDRFIFQDQLDTIDDFNLELSIQAIDILRDRNEITSRSGKTRTITYTDPLSEESFSL